MGLFVAFLMVVISTNQAASCPPGEYETNNLCCPMCNVGTVVKSHCTTATSSSVCIPCVEGTYMDHPNGLTECFKCTECDIGAGLVEKKKCTYTSNTECECKPGHFCVGSSCDLCMEHTVCSPGQYVRVQGSPKRDTECEDCPFGYYSVGYMSETCTAWTDCQEMGRVRAVTGTKTSDSVCAPARHHYLVIIPAFSAVIILVSLLFCLTKCKGKEQEKEKEAQPIHECGQKYEVSGESSIPVQETDPMQTER